MKQYLVPTLLSISLGLFSCKKEDDALLNHDVTSVAGPTTGNVNTVIKIIVTYPYSNGCDLISSFGQTVSGNTVTIKAYAKPVSKQAICTMDAGFKTIEYSFSAGAAGVYELLFMKLDGSSVNHTVTLQ